MNKERYVGLCESHDRVTTVCVTWTQNIFLYNNRKYSQKKGRKESDPGVSRGSQCESSPYP